MLTTRYRFGKSLPTFSNRDHFMANSDIRTHFAGRPVPVIFSDLDGTLLETHSYSFESSRLAIQSVLRRGIPLIFCSSKTRLEQEFIQRRLGFRAPFITENGGAIYIPQNFFEVEIDFPHRTASGYHIIELGVPYAEVRQAVVDIRNRLGLKLLGYGDLPLTEICMMTGLEPPAVGRAARREYSESLHPRFVTAEELNLVQQHLKEYGLRGTLRERFFIISGANTDKGRAVAILSEIFRKAYGRITTYGLGDGSNDIPLLSAVEHPILVQKPDKSWESMNIPGLLRMEGVGPIGWEAAIRKKLGI